jgi:hypothetical protein
MVQLPGNPVVVALAPIEKPLSHEAGSVWNGQMVGFSSFYDYGEKPSMVRS